MTADARVRWGSSKGANLRPVSCSRHSIHAQFSVPVFVVPGVCIGLPQQTGKLPACVMLYLDRTWCRVQYLSSVPCLVRYVHEQCTGVCFTTKKQALLSTTDKMLLVPMSFWRIQTNVTSWKICFFPMFFWRILTKQV